ncbi:MAG TPA: DUF4127 family protein [Devosia sp.]|nr:DUF4127 family protein [Devosia sp.]
MKSGSTALRIALLPLDERPVNITLPRQIAAIAGAELLLPPRRMLPDLRQPGRTDDLGAWLEAVAGEVDAVVVSIDMLCYGGLIAGRTSADPLSAALGRLDALRRVRTRHPKLPLAAVSLVMRASDSYNPQEEPDYWARHGRELHRLGALHHQVFAGVAGADADLARLRAALPADIVADFERRRLRNHQINLAALSLAADRVLDTLLITADDTAEYSAGSLEQVWLAQWAATLPPGGEVLMYPGADEVAAILVARQLGALPGATARLAVECADPAGLQRIANYENSPLAVAIERQVKASGGVVAADRDAMALLIHAPDPRRRDLCGQVPQFDDADRAEAEKTADLAASLIAAGREVALADVRYSNGGDPLLIEALRQRGVLLELVAYGGWNTAGNALGSVVAAAAAIQAGRAAGTYDAAAARRLLLHRLIEDYGYQALLRRPYNAGILTFDAAAERVAVGEVGAGLNDVLQEITGKDTLTVRDVSFPWHRSFEIDLAIAGDLR